MQALFRKIILATDFSDTSKDASSHAILLARTYQAELKILHVFNLYDLNARNVPPSYYFIEKARQQGKDNLKELANSLDLEVETIFTEGDPGHEIVRVAEELNVDLIVLGTHGYSGWKRFTLGSVAELVVRHAPCTVFIIRPKER